MKTIVLETAFYTNEYTETPDKTVLSFTQEDIDRLQHLQAIAKKEDVSIRWDFREDEYLESDDTTCEWRSDFSCIQIYSSGLLYYFAQNKWDSADQFETESFDLETINNSKHEAES